MTENPIKRGLVQAAEMSALFEQVNAENPHMPQVPVVYPKATRRRQ